MFTRLRLTGLVVVPLLFAAACAPPPPTDRPSAEATASSEPTAEPTDDSPEPTGSSTPEPTVSPSPTASASPSGATTTCEYRSDGSPAKPVDPPPTKDVPTTGEAVFTLVTNQGSVTVTMDRSIAPCTVNSFESLATQGYFDDTTCHRLVDSGIFVLQCGDPTGTGTGGPGYVFDDELPQEKPDSRGVINYRGGTVAMANAGPGTNGSQFFLVYDDSPLPPDYTIFGQMDDQSRGIVARIAVEGQDGTSPGGGGKPNNPAEIRQVVAG